MSRLRYPGLKAALDAGISDSDTAVTFTAPLAGFGGLSAVPDIDAGSYLPLSLLDSNGLVVEIAHLTAYDHTDGTGTLLRGQEGSTAQSHAAGAVLVNAPTPFDVLMFDVTAYDARGDGITDDTAAINAAIADLNAAGAGRLYFPAGQYVCTDELTPVTAHAHIYGDGAGDLQAQNAASSLFFDSTTGDLLTLDADGIIVENLGFENPTSTTQTAGSAIKVTQGDRNTYRNVSVRGFHDCVDIFDGALWTMEGCYLVGPVQYALLIEHVDLPDGGDMVVRGNWFYAATRDATAAVKYVTGGGLKFSDNKINTLFNDGQFSRGLDADIGSTTAVLTVTGNSIENVTAEAIRCQGDLLGCTIVGNEIAYYGGSLSVTAISVHIWNSVTVVGNAIVATGSSSAAAITVTGSTNIVIGLNSWHNFAEEYDISSTTQVTVIPRDLGDLADVDTTGASTNDGLKFNGTTWEPGSFSGTGTVDTIVPGTNITVDDTDPANPIVSATGGGGGGGGGAELRLDVVPGSPSVWDDEFDGSSLDAKWDTGSQPLTIAVDGGQLSMAAQGNLYAGFIVQDAPTGDFTVSAKIASPLAFHHSDLRPGLMIVDTSNTKALVVGLELVGGSKAMFIEHNNYSEVADWGAFDGTFSDGFGGLYVGGWLWHRVRWVSADSKLYCDYSADGVSWWNWGYRAWSVQPDKIGLCLECNNNNTSAGEALDVAWFRVTE